ncbi:MAG: mechanosensitive ion channel [Pyrinomonadaceae bacterium]
MFLQNSNTSKIIDNASQISQVTYNSINNLITAIFDRLPNIAAGILVLVLFWLLGKIFKAAFRMTTQRTKLDSRLRILFSRLIGIVVVILGIFTAFTVIVPSFRFGDLIAGLGFTSFIVGFAAKDILNNLLSGVLILWHQPFRIGDYIFIKDKEGKVEYIGVRATTLRMDDGEKILMPNGDMYSNALVIRGAGAERRKKLQFSIGYEADIKRAKSSILECLRDLDGVSDDLKPNVYVTELASEGVRLSVYFWINTNTHKAIEVVDKVATVIKEALSRADIELYPPGSVIVQNAGNNTSDNYTNGRDAS